MQSGKRKRKAEADGEDLEEEGENQAGAEQGANDRDDDGKTAETAPFTGTGAELARSIQNGSIDAIREALSQLRYSTSLKTYDEHIAASDKRVQLATQYVAADGIGGPHNSSSILKAWSIFHAQKQMSLLPLPLFALSNLIAVLGAHQPNHSIVEGLILAILPKSSISETDPQSSQYWDHIQQYISNVPGKNGTNVKAYQQAQASTDVVIMASIRLLLELTTFAGGKYARAVFDSMNWNTKSLSRLLHMRRRQKSAKKAAKSSAKEKEKRQVNLDRPDIRTLWLLFLLSFLRTRSGASLEASVQISALSLGKDFLPAILKGLAKDSSQIVIHVLMVLHDALLSDEAASRLPRSKVSCFFSEWACKELLSLYDREEDMVSVAGTEETHSIADVSHHFMLALCTHPGRGVCYRDQGWYGRQRSRDAEEEGEEGSSKETGVYNKILLGLLRSLSPTRSVKQAELSLRILQSSQELLAPYLNFSGGALSSSNLEPRPTSIAWLSTVAFLGRVLCIPLPTISEWKDAPPPLERCLESLLPASLTRAVLQRGLQHKDRLTRHTSLLLLSRMLARARDWKELCAAMARKHTQQYETRAGEVIVKSPPRDDDDDDKSLSSTNPWTRLMSTVLEEVRLRSPELSFILETVALHATDKKAANAESGEVASQHQPESTLLAEAALRAAKYYNGLFYDASPSDISVLLASTSLSPSHREVGEGGLVHRHDAPTLGLMCQMHAIQLLTKDSSQTVGLLELHGKQSSKIGTPFRSLLHLASTSTLDQVRLASWQLIGSTMINSVLFEQHAMEWPAWQYALQQSTTELLDFFDECIQRCLKTPYRYFEMMRDQLPADCVDFHISPIFFTMQEQYFIRLQNGLFGTQEMRTAFPHFLGYFMPALHSVQYGNDLQEIRTAGLNLSRGLMGRLRDALRGSKDSNVKDRVHASQNEQKEIVGGFMHAHHIVVVLIEGSQRSMQDVINGDALADLVMEYETPLQPSLSTSVFRFIGLSGEEASSADLDEPELSLEETRMLIAYCRNCIVLDTISIQKTRQLLQLTLRLGNLSSARELFAVFAHEQVLSQCQKSPDWMEMLVSTLSHSPLNWIGDAVNADECAIPPSLLSTAVKSVCGGEQATLRPLQETVVSVFPSLTPCDRLMFWQSAQEVDLYFEAGLCCLEQFLEWVSSNCHGKILHIVKEGTTDLRLKGIFFMRSFSAHGGSGLTYKFGEMVEEEIIKLLLCRADAHIYDIALSAILEESTSAYQAFWRKAIDDDIDATDLAERLPYSLVAASAALNTPNAHCDGWRLSKSGLTKFGKTLLASFFNFKERISPLIAQVVCNLAPFVDFEECVSARILLENLSLQSSRVFRQELLLCVEELIDRHPEETAPRALLTAILDNACLWLVRRFAEDEEDSSELLHAIEALIIVFLKCGSHVELKAHLVQPVLTAVVANRRRSLLHLQLTNQLMTRTMLKDNVIERLLTDIMADGEVLSDIDRCNEVVDMLYCNVSRQPRLCQADLIKLASGLYKGTLSDADRKMMCIFRQYEETCKSSIMNLLQRHWRTSSLQGANEIDLGILSRMESVQIHETCLKFPRGRCFEDLVASGFTEDIDSREVQGAVYDPLLIMSAVGGLLTGGTGSDRLSGLHWLELARTNALGVAACCLSSTSVSTRVAARNILAKVHSSVQSAQFQERDFFLLILDYVRNSYRAQGEKDDGLYLPLTTTLFIAHAIRSLGTPSIYLFPLISHFLLQRPLPDPTDVPLLYSFLYSSSTQSTTSQAEKTFIVRYILTCITYGGKAEWLVLKRRHVWDSLCSLYASEDASGSIKRIIEHIFVSISRKPDLAFRIVVRHAFLQYLGQLQQLQVNASEEMSSNNFLIQCMTNLLESLDMDRLQKALGPGYMVSFAEVLDPVLCTTKSSTDWNTAYNTLVLIKLLKKHGIDVECENIAHRFPDPDDKEEDLEKEQNLLLEKQCRDITLELFDCEPRRLTGTLQSIPEPVSLFGQLLDRSDRDVDASAACFAELPGNEPPIASTGIPNWSIGLGSIFSTGT